MLQRTVRCSWNWSPLIIQKCKKKKKSSNVVLSLWCSSADVQPVCSLGANLDPLLSSFSPNQIKLSWNLILTPFFPSWKSDYVVSHLLKCWEVPSLLVFGQMSRHFLSSEDRFSEGLWHHRASTAGVLHYLPSSHPSFCIRWSERRCRDYRGCHLHSFKHSSAFKRSWRSSQKRAHLQE